MKKDKSIKNTEQLPVVTKVDTGEYVEFDDWRGIPVSSSYLANLADKLIVWAVTDNDADKLNEFYVTEKIHKKSFYRWMEKSNALKRAHELAMMAIGNRREKNGLRRIYDSGMISKSMPIYDEDWKALEEWRSKMTKEENAGNEQKVVIIEKFPDSPEVKPKRTPEEVAAAVVSKTKNGH